jgi:hypothetical protein
MSCPSHFGQGRLLFEASRNKAQACSSFPAQGPVVAFDSSQLYICSWKVISMLDALGSTTGLTWGMSLSAGLRLYSAIVRPVIIYGANAWYTPITIKGFYKIVTNRLKAIQGSSYGLSRDPTELRQPKWLKSRHISNLLISS